MKEPTPNDAVSSVSTLSRKRGGPITFVLDMFSSVRFGIVLLTLLFIYSTIGSAGILYPVGFDIFSAENWRHSFPRTWRGIELTEFAFFHTWMFNAIIALICLNITITTIRRIPFNALKAGVWMIHTGIIILCIGSVIYFATKVEGDAPVVRREVVVSFPGSNIAPTSMLALPGNSAEAIGPSGRYRFQISQIDPEWPLLSGEDEGKKVYSVSVMVQTPDGKSFIRQLLAGFPQYTEDVIPGKGRAKKQPEFNGEALIDTSFDLSLDYAVRDRFWVKDTTSVYARFAGTRPWVERQMGRLPRYNDYLTSPEDVWSFRPGEVLPIDPLDIEVPSEASVIPAGSDDPLVGVQARVVGFIRYAFPRASLVPGGGKTNPIVDVRFRNAEGRIQDARLVAMDPRRAVALEGLVSFRWVTDAAAVEELARSGNRSLEVQMPGMAEAMMFDLASQDLAEGSAAKPMGDTGYSYRITNLHERLPTSDGTTEINVLVVEFTGPNGFKVTRWVADDPTRSRDVGPPDPHTGHTAMMAPDASVQARYIPSKLSAVTLVAGPGDVGLWALIGADENGMPRREKVTVGQPLPLTSALVMEVQQFMVDAVEEVRPTIVPREQRDRNTDEVRIASHVKVELSKGDWKEAKWVRFHRYPFESDAYQTAGLSPYEPVDFTLPDGRHVEMIVAQQSYDLPHEVALEDFVLTEHVGGFEMAGSAGVRDWTSMLKFSEDEGKTWSAPRAVSPNKPVEQDGWWYFQAYWDPPRAQDRGLNFTGLGIGNRHGVYTQLAGCAISVAGMIYAFYVKPIIRRKRREKVLAQMASGELAPAKRLAEEIEEPELVNGERR